MEAETFGEITTDYSIEIERREGSARKYALAEIGAGGGTLEIRSNRGRIKLLRSN